MNPWLGADRGFLTDWITQRWVRVTGRRVALADAPWLRGPVAAPTGVADDEFDRYAARERLAAQPESDDHGLLEDFGALRSQRFDPARIRPEVVDFYERTRATRCTSGRSGRPPSRRSGAPSTGSSPDGSASCSSRWRRSTPAAAST